MMVLFEEQRLKISVVFNDPLPCVSPQARAEALLVPRGQVPNRIFSSKRLEFSHSVRISKESKLGVLKARIAKQLALEMSAFRLRKSSNSAELRDLQQTLQLNGIGDGGLVFVEHGVPAGPKEMCVSFSLYDANKLLTDPHNKKRCFAQKLFEHPFPRSMKVKDVKALVVPVLNRLFPLYRGEHSFAAAVKLLLREDKEREEREVEALKRATELSKQAADAQTETGTGMAIAEEKESGTANESGTEPKSQRARHSVSVSV